MPKTSTELVAEANAQIKALSVQQAIDLLAQDDVVFIDLRDSEELRATGRIPGAIHVPRGTLEWAADPATSRFVPVFGSAKQLVVYCAGGGRSALSTKLLQDMGYDNVTHVQGGITNWITNGGPVDKAG
jgi:rhodanese-related sulfurtransferase